jgi:hypothetical protein
MATSGDFCVATDTPRLDVAAERVATDPDLQDMDFGRWDFASRPDTVAITVDPLNLPQHEDGVPVLHVGAEPLLSLSWQITPAPLQAPGLTHYLIELLSSGESAEVAYASGSIALGKIARKTYKLKDLAQRVRGDELPEGLYQARVTAWAGATNITAGAPNGEKASNLTGTTTGNRGDA